MKTHKQNNAVSNARNKATNGAKKPAKATRHTTKPAKKLAQRIMVMGYTFTSFCRGLGNAGFKAGDAVTAIQRIAKNAPESTIRTQVSKAKFAPDMKLKREEIKRMRKLVAA